MTTERPRRRAPTSGLFEALFQANPTPTAIVDDEVVVLAANAAARGLLGAELTRAGRHLGAGELLGCRQTASGTRCGAAPACGVCPIRHAVRHVWAQGGTQRTLAHMQVAGWAGGAPHLLHLRVTASALETPHARRVLLALEDVSDRVELEALLPICAWCKRVRTGAAYWQAVDEFLRTRLDVELTHGMCDECERRHFADGADAPPTSSAPVARRITPALVRDLEVLLGRAGQALERARALLDSDHGSGSHVATAETAVDAAVALLLERPSSREPPRSSNPGDVPSCGGASRGSRRPDD